MDLSFVLNNIRENSKWSIRGDKIYNNLRWNTENITIKPTLEECQEYWNTHGTPYLMNLLREERDKKLLETDKYTSIPDWPHASEEVKQAWITYRQELRDLPSTSTPQLDSNAQLTNTKSDSPYFTRILSSVCIFIILL